MLRDRQMDYSVTNTHTFARTTDDIPAEGTVQAA